MNKLKLLFPLFTILMNAGCASFGPTVRIETPEPAEDFVIICTWAKHGLIDFHGGKKLSDEKVYVTQSGKNVDCGMSLWGGDALATYMHPIYTGGDASTTEIIDGVEAIRPITKLQRLDELKAKFEVGYWDNYPDPGFEYANNLIGCGFPHQYFDYYSQVKTVDVEHFKNLYNDPIKQCLSITTPIYKKYQPRSSKKLPDADTWMDIFWNPEKWSKYK